MKMRMAQYGIGHDHAAGKARVMRESDAVELAGVCEPSERLRAALGGDSTYTGVHWFATPEEMLEDSSIEAIAVEGRVSDNLAFARACLEHGKHVWLDKPAGDDLEAFAGVLDLAAERKLHLQLGYMFRYNAGFQFIVDWATSGRLGAILSVRARISTRPSTADGWMRWDSRGERAGGIMFILAGHLIDIVVALLGRPHGVTPFARQHSAEFPGSATTPPRCWSIPRRWRWSSRWRRRWTPWRRAGWRCTAPAAVPFWSRWSRQRCACVWMPTAMMGMAPAGGRWRWSSAPRYVESLRAFMATIRDEQPADRTFAHELAVQETILAAAGCSPWHPRRKRGRRPQGTALIADAGHSPTGAGGRACGRGRCRWRPAATRGRLAAAGTARCPSRRCDSRIAIATSSAARASSPEHCGGSPLAMHATKSSTMASPLA